MTQQPTHWKSDLQLYRESLEGLGTQSEIDDAVAMYEKLNPDSKITGVYEGTIVINRNANAPNTLPPMSENKLVWRDTFGIR